MSKITKEQVEQVEQVRMARLEGWRRMAKEMKNHQILSVELLRTRQDETAAVFTVSRNGEIVQFLVRGDSRGRLIVPAEPRDDDHEHHHHHHHHHHHDHHEHGHHEHGHHECADDHDHRDHGRHDRGHEHGRDRGYAVQFAESGASMQAEAAATGQVSPLGQVRQAFMAMAAAAPADDPTDPNIIALGIPPPKQEPPPGIAAVGGVLLASAFDVAEQVPTSADAPPQ